MRSGSRLRDLSSLASSSSTTRASSAAIRGLRIRGHDAGLVELAELDHQIHVENHVSRLPRLGVQDLEHLGPTPGPVAYGRVEHRQEETLAWASLGPSSIDSNARIDSLRRLYLMESRTARSRCSSRSPGREATLCSTRPRAFSTRSGLTPPAKASMLRARPAQARSARDAAGRRLEQLVQEGPGLVGVVPVQEEVRRQAQGRRSRPVPEGLAVADLGLIHLADPPVALGKRQRGVLRASVSSAAAMASRSRQPGLVRPGQVLDPGLPVSGTEGAISRARRNSPPASSAFPDDIRIRPMLRWSAYRVEPGRKRPAGQGHGALVVPVPDGVEGGRDRQVPGLDPSIAETRHQPVDVVETGLARSAGRSSRRMTAGWTGPGQQLAFG